jgi:hypothetical protein
MIERGLVKGSGSNRDRIGCSWHGVFCLLKGLGSVGKYITLVIAINTYLPQSSKGHFHSGLIVIFTTSRVSGPVQFVTVGAWAMFYPVNNQLVAVSWWPGTGFALVASYPLRGNQRGTTRT